MDEQFLKRFNIGWAPMHHEDGAFVPGVLFDGLTMAQRLSIQTRYQILTANGKDPEFEIDAMLEGFEKLNKSRGII
jgi:hypothetical protein